ncbi:hypothetical protein [Nocardia sp. NPDC004860]|uniref:hypothetical protein n=1 Tax=Nocardia sp. NPDC004860 TaxID=3154557 RepID=UPI0033BA52B1
MATDDHQDDRTAHAPKAPLNQKAAASENGRTFQAGRDLHNISINLGNIIWLLIFPVIAAVGLLAYSVVWPMLRQSVSAEPLTVSIAYAKGGVSNGNPGCGNLWMFDRPLSLIRPPVSGILNETWAQEAGGVDMFTTWFKISLQGASVDAVNIHGMRIIDVDRTPATAKQFVADQACGGTTDVRNFQINLDPTPPQIIYNNGMTFAFTVSNSDIEEFDVKAVLNSKNACDCISRWRLALDWSHMGKSYTTVIDNNGVPFQTAAVHSFSATARLDGKEWVR